MDCPVAALVEVQAIDLVLRATEVVEVVEWLDETGRGSCGFRLALGAGRNRHCWFMLGPARSKAALAPMKIQSSKKTTRDGCRPTGTTCPGSPASRRVD